MTVVASDPEASIAAAVAGEQALPLVLLSPTFDGFTLPVVAQQPFVLTTDPEEGSAQRTSAAGRWVVSLGSPRVMERYFPDYASAASAGALLAL